MCIFVRYKTQWNDKKGQCCVVARSVVFISHVIKAQQSQRSSKEAWVLNVFLFFLNIFFAMNLTNSTSRKRKQAQHPSNPALLCRHLSFSCFRSLITFNSILESVSKFESATCNFFRFYETYFYSNIKNEGGKRCEPPLTTFLLIRFKLFSIVCIINNDKQWSALWNVTG